MFVISLRNAHAIENRALSMMRQEPQDMVQNAEIAARLEQLVAETKGEIGRLEHILQKLDEDYLNLGAMVVSLASPAGVMSHASADETVLNNACTGFAFENYEIATYESLLTIAGTGKVGNAGAAFQANLAEEQAMSKWLDDHMPSLTQTFLLM